MKRFFALFLPVLSDDCQDSWGSVLPEFESIRIRIEYDLSEENPLLQNHAMPAAVDFLQKSIRVRRRGTSLSFPRPCKLRPFSCIENGIPVCGTMEIPNKDFGDYDLVVFVSDPSTEVPFVMANSQICQMDSCGRPTAGRINFYPGAFRKMSSGEMEKQVDDLVELLIHEFIHILAFNTFSLTQFRDRATLVPLVKNPKHVAYKCKEVDGKYSVDWGVTLPELYGLKWEYIRGTSPDGYHVLSFIPEVVRPVQARDLTLDMCRCPMDWTKTYTSEDIEDCLNRPMDCAFAVVTPKVREETLLYFDSSEGEGMEVENTSGIECGSHHEVHWKHRLVVGEILTPSTMEGRLMFISPMTFALLEDSGWYKADYGMTTSLRVMNFDFWGYHTGRAFMQDKCIDDEKGLYVAGSRMNFCDAKDSTWRISGSHFYKIQCHDGSLLYRRDNPIVSLNHYKYKSHPFMHNMQSLDYCPAYLLLKGGSCLGTQPRSGRTPSGEWYGLDSRALEMELWVSTSNHVQLRSPTVILCTKTICSPDGKSYRVSLYDRINPELCTRKGQEIYFAERRTIVHCADPEIICAYWHFPHLPNFTNHMRLRAPHGHVAPENHTKARTMWSMFTWGNLENLAP